MPLIQVEHLKYRYPHTEKLALSDLNFTVDAGSLIGIAGASQAGKSTLCYALSGLVPSLFKGAYGGRVLIGELEAGKLPASKLCGTVGLVFQNPFNQLTGASDTVFGEVAFGLQNLGIPQDEILRRVEEKLRLLDLLPYAERDPFSLSGGQVQRVALASILAMEPKVLLLDEPTSQLDPQASDDVFRIAEQLAGQGMTILMAEQKIDRLASFCGQLLLLHQGRQLVFDTPKHIFTDGIYKKAGIPAPVCTELCRHFQVTDEAGLYPVSAAETAARKAQFPHEKTQAKEHTAQAETARHSGHAVSETPTKPLFKLRGLSFAYDEAAPVFADFSLELDARPTGIIGQNGAGKTTLAKLLKGLLRPKKGELLFHDEPLSNRTVAALAPKIGYVFQNPDDQIFKAKVLDEVMFGPLTAGFSQKEAELHAKKALACMELSDMILENPYDLDLSSRKLLAIASVLAMEPEVLILDEPTIAQDLRGRQLIGNMIRTQAAEGRAVYAVLHDMELAAAYFSRILVLAHGKILADGAPEEVFYQLDALKKAHVEQPQATKLAAAIGYKGTYLKSADLF